MIEIEKIKPGMLVENSLSGKKAIILGKAPPNQHIPYAFNVLYGTIPVVWVEEQGSGEKSLWLLENIV